MKTKTVVFGKDKTVLAARMKVKLETIFIWQTKSGMIVNESKTCLCVFFKHDCTPLIVDINGKFLISQKTINVLGVRICHMIHSKSSVKMYS